MKRERFLAGAMSGAMTMRAPAATAARYDASAALDDFEALWAFVDSQYCYFGQKSTNWRAAHTYYGDLIRRASAAKEAFAALELLLDELYDPHSHLGSNTGHSYRLPPYDMSAEWSGSVAQIKSVRPGSPSASAGLRAGDAIIRIGGTTLIQACRERTPHFVDESDPDVRRWTLNSVLSGRHDTPRMVDVQFKNGTVGSINCDRTAEIETTNSVTWKIVSKNAGYVRVPTFADATAVTAFDKALADLRHTRLLLIDIRENGGGDTAVTRPIMRTLHR